MGALSWELGNDVDCDGVLSLWVCGSVSEEGESVERGRAAGGGELLFAGVELSACEEHHSQSEYVR